MDLPSLNRLKRFKENLIELSKIISRIGVAHCSFFSGRVVKSALIHEPGSSYGCDRKFQLINNP